MSEWLSRGRVVRALSLPMHEVGGSSLSLGNDILSLSKESGYICSPRSEKKKKKGKGFRKTTLRGASVTLSGF